MPNAHPEATFLFAQQFKISISTKEKIKREKYITRIKETVTKCL